MKALISMTLGGILLLAACKKEDAAITKPTTPKTTGPNVAALTRVAPDNLYDEVGVSNYGFLVLPDTPVYSNYLDFLDNNNTDDINAFLSAKNVTSQAGVNDQADNYFPPSGYNAEYIFNQSGIVQVGNLVFRGVNSEGYLLAMPVSMLNGNTYTELVNKEFDESNMCKLWIGGDEATDMPSLEAFVNNNLGYDGTAGTNPPPPINVSCRKVTHTYSAGGVTVIDTSWYFLGFRYRHEIIIIT